MLAPDGAESMTATTRVELPAGEVTFLFTDIADSTTHFHAHGDAWLQVIEAHDRVLVAAITAQGGVVVKHEGDAIFAAFPGAAAAVRAAVEGQRALAAGPLPTAADIKVRMGLHTGQAQPVRSDYISLEVHLAARVVAAAHGEQIVVSATTAEAALTDPDWSTEMSFRELGRFRLRGFDTPETLLQVCHPTLRCDFEPLRAASAKPPPPAARATSFVGRTAEVEAVTARLAQSALVTLTGPGGVGKTRLAVEVARRLDPPDGVWVVELASIADDALVAGAVAAAVGIDGEAETELVATVASRLAERAAVLVLDNCEHVIAGAARLAAALLARDPATRVIATSRLALDVDGEQVLRIRPLGLPDDRATTAIQVLASDAGHLFADRAAAGRAGFEIDEGNARLVADLCRRLDGLPLAIELAAARLRSQDLQTLASRLDQQVFAGRRGDRTREERQQNLVALISWSVDLLDAGAATTLARLSVFAGHFDLDDAEAMHPKDDQAEVIDRLTALVDASLVELDDGPSGQQYRLLETIRRFARQRLAVSDDTLARHREWFLGSINANVEGLHGPDRSRSAEDAAAIEAVDDDLAAALTWSVERGDGPEALALAMALALAWRCADRDDDVARVVAGALEVDRTSAAAAPLLVVAADVAARRGQLEDARAAAEEARAIATSVGDLRTEADAWIEMSTVSWTVGDPAAAEREARHALELARRLDDPSREAGAHLMLGLAAEFTGAHDRQLEAMSNALSAGRRAGDDPFVATALVNVGNAMIYLGRHDEARPALEEALALQLRHGSRLQVALTLSNLSYSAQLAGDIDRATAWADEAVSISRELGTSRALALALNNRGELEAIAGDLDAAAMSYLEALDAGVELGEVDRVSFCLDGLATVAFERGDSGAATLLLAGADRFRRDRGFRRPAEYEAAGESLALRSREALGAEEFDVRWAQGSALSHDDLLAAARESTARTATQSSGRRDRAANGRSTGQRGKR